MNDPLDIVALVNPNATYYRKRPFRVEKDRNYFKSLGWEVLVAGNESDIRAGLRPVSRRGITHLVVKGGDGTFHYILNELYNKQADENPVKFPVIVPIAAGTTNTLASYVSKQGLLKRWLFSILSGNRDQIGAEAKVCTFKVNCTGKQKESITILGTSIHIAGLFNRFYELFFQRNENILGNIFSALWLAFRVSRKKDEIEDESMNSLFKPYPVVIEVDKQPWREKEYSLLDVASATVRIWHFLRFFTDIPAGKLRLVAGQMTPVEVFKALWPIFFAEKMSGKNYTEYDVTEVLVKEAPGFPLRPAIDGEIYEGLGDMELTPGPEIQLMSLEKLLELKAV